MKGISFLVKVIYILLMTNTNHFLTKQHSLQSDSINYRNLRASLYLASLTQCYLNSAALYTVIRIYIKHQDIYFYECK